MHGTKIKVIQIEKDLQNIMRNNEQYIEKRVQYENTKLKPNFLFAVEMKYLIPNQITLNNYIIQQVVSVITSNDMIRYDMIGDA